MLAIYIASKKSWETSYTTTGIQDGSQNSKWLPTMYNVVYIAVSLHSLHQRDSFGFIQDGFIYFSEQQLLFWEKTIVTSCELIKMISTESCGFAQLSNFSMKNDNLQIWGHFNVWWWGTEAEFNFRWRGCRIQHFFPFQSWLMPRTSDHQKLVLTFPWIDTAFWWLSH